MTTAPFNAIESKVQITRVRRRTRLYLSVGTFSQRKKNLLHADYPNRVTLTIEKLKNRRDYNRGREMRKYLNIYAYAKGLFREKLYFRVFNVL